MLELGFIGQDIKYPEASFSGKSLVKACEDAEDNSENYTAVLNFLYRVDGDIRIRANYPKSIYDLISNKKIKMPIINIINKF